MDGRITWEGKSFYTSDSEEEIECSENRLHEVTMLNCNMMTRSLCYVSSKVRHLPIYNGLNEVDVILDAFEREVPEKTTLPSLRLGTLRYTCKMVGYAQRNL